ncbi:hypothetical protein BRE01_59830 [Brevibacillus reuszeri]|uniref:Uncharacterized protein n=1 Tax=Brevibacillus reuszeri TaxID=54915 RepID=A0A0K9YNH1_9BACL|nr:hypothetical protein [Brevibacillus reuszeri]KNB70264.1 hypothetical protein ADS79_14965 [Brevibacillus reuszeri]MED1859223.1 hypothetical protein [Brevibacillus reuszeri]GED72281.1 hypothetical protein BRE01_59830 [Brevibacillus reuszeri]
MRDYEQEIARLKSQVTEATTLLAELEAEHHAYVTQCERRTVYLSSREILELLESRKGRVGSMATIKRWADQGYLGKVVDEREAFPLLVSKQGNKRFLYPREAVFRFLHEKGLLLPLYDVLDRVQIRIAEKKVSGLVTAIERYDQNFSYQVQLEATGEILSSIAEEDLFLP